MIGYDCPYCAFYIDDYLPGIEISDGAYAEVTCSNCRAVLQIEVTIEVIAEGDKSKKAKDLTYIPGM